MSDLERELEFQLKAVKIGGFEREYRFNPERRWRFDFAWPNPKVAVEIDGGIYREQPGRHNRGAGMEKDNEKLNWAVSRGWKILRVGPNQVKTGEAVGWIETTLAYWSNGRGDAA
jgi:very-short-patch-repair endonuclease